MAKKILCHEEVKEGENKAVIKLLNDLNVSRMVETEMKVTKTLILMDATGSMGTLLSKAKNAVGIMFEAAGDVLR